MWRFLSTPSARRATIDVIVRAHLRLISIHALREEGDGLRCRPCGQRRHFYPRPPRGGRLAPLLQKDSDIAISIHALREEGDNLTGGKLSEIRGFLSTPSARRATAGSWPIRRNTFHRFLSTPSARRATAVGAGRHLGAGDFYPRPPRGGRPATPLWPTRRFSYFYPRPPRGGRPLRPV